jgi:hypothetical protein
MREMPVDPEEVEYREKLRGALKNIVWCAFVVGVCLLSIAVVLAP